MSQMKSLPLPIVDFSAFQGTKRDKKRLIREIDQASQSAGFFFLVNHSVDAKLIDATVQGAINFFNQPQVVKDAISISKSNHFRGYFGFGDELLDAKNHQGDYKEGVKIGRDLPENHPYVQKGLPLHGANQWPDDEPWKYNIEHYMQSCRTLGEQLMSIFAMALGEAEDYFTEMLIEPMITLTPLHYPPAKPKGTVGAAAHSDYGCLTIIYQHQIAGLEIYDQQRQRWLEVPVLADTLVVNIGDMLQRWSNDRYISTRHRVINRTDQQRYSLAFFYDPNFYALLKPLPNCFNEGNPCRHAIVTAGEYLLKRMNRSFTKL